MFFFWLLIISIVTQRMGEEENPEELNISIKNIELAFGY